MGLNQAEISLLVAPAGSNACQFDRSELVGPDCCDIVVHRLDGLRVRLRRSKTDQNGLALPFTASPPGPNIEGLRLNTTRSSCGT